MDNKLVERLKQERLRLDYNQPELANKMNVSKQTVSNWENGNRTPDIETLSSLADLFSCSIDYLLGRTDERKAIICEYDIDGENVIMAVSKDVYPNGLTKEEVIEKLKIIKKMEDMGIQFPVVEQD